MAPLARGHKACSAHGQRHFMELAARHADPLCVKPILVGGVFNSVNPSVYAAREAADNPKFKHSWRVMKDWAALAGIEINSFDTLIEALANRIEFFHSFYTNIRNQFFE